MSNGNLNSIYNLIMGFTVLGVCVMSRKEYTYALRVKIERLAKLTSCIMTLTLISLFYWFDLHGMITDMLVVICWYYIPDVAAFIYECLLHVRHKFDSYR